MKTVAAALVLVFGLLSVPAMAQQTQAPLTEKEVFNIFKKNKKDQLKAAAIVSERGVGFELTEEFAKKLQKAGAELSFLQAIVGASPVGRSFTTPLGKTIEVAPEVKLAFMGIQNELDPARQLTMINEFGQKYPDSPVLSYVLTYAARFYQQKGDFEKTVEYAERSLKLDPDNVFSLVLEAMILPQPRMLQGTPVENDEKLTKAESCANRAIELAEEMPAERLETDEQLRRQQGSVISDAHGSLGMVYLHREDFPKAQEEFKTAISSATTPNPTNYYRLGEAYEFEGKIDQAIDAFQHAADLGQGTGLKSFADKKLAELKAQKGTLH